MSGAVMTQVAPPMLEPPTMEKSTNYATHTTTNGPEKTMTEKQKPESVIPHSASSASVLAQFPMQHTQPRAGPSTTAQNHHLLSTHLLAHPDNTVKRAIHTQFPLPNPLIRLVRRFAVKHSVIKGMTDREWKKYEKQGPELMKKAGWKKAGAPAEEEGVEVGELFWKMYLSLLPTVERDPLSGLVPPDLLGSTTTVPLTIISLIPDIMQHYHDVIIRAREEVFLATNYWQPSNSVTTITGSLLELSALVVKEGRKKIVVKIMYDRGSLEQIYNSHAPVAKDKWKPLDLPGPDEIPGLELEVINFHRVLLGTFHAKFLIVDRKVALINSNNIQDRPNLELMSHLEGPIVDSFYEIALHSWYNRLSPPLPCLSTPYTPPNQSSSSSSSDPNPYLFSHDNPFFDDIEVLKAAKAARLLLRQQTIDQASESARMQADGQPAGDRLRDAVRRVVDHQRQNLAEWRPGERFDESVHNAMAELREMRERLAGAVGAGGQGGRSRPGSRGPSRRGSANEGMFRNFMKSGEKSDTITSPTAIAPATTISAPAVDPSEAPSSPTIAETPLKKQFNQPGHELESINNSPNMLHDQDEPSSPRRPTTHVAFAPVIADGNTIPRTSTPDDMSSHKPRQAPPPIITGLAVNGDSTSNTPTSAQHRGYPQPDVAMRGSQDKVIGVENGLGLESAIMANPGEGEEEDGRRTSMMTDTIIPEGMGSKRLYKMSKMFNAAGVLSEAWATVPDSDELDTFQPHVIHQPHMPVPVAMACRKPHGFPGHHDIRNPQNAAWLAGFRYAKKRVFIQTPTLNARPIVRAIKQTCRRGVSVELLLDLGFNDKGESIPFQGGTNEEVVVRLYKALRKEGKEEFLKVYWYTGKDQVRPLNAVKKQRNCHIKFAAYDDEVLIIGNGNQDSQSWFHSQEVNIMVDSKQLIKEMMETLLTNQNTIQYGLVDTDGIWRDKEGKTLQDYGATEGGRFKGLSGFIQFAKTI